MTNPTPTTDPTATLKPCPFCGGEASDGYRVAYSCDSSFDYIGCKDGACDAQMPYYNSNDRAATIAAWNRRATPATPTTDSTAADVLAALS